MVNESWAVSTVFEESRTIGPNRTSSAHRDVSAAVAVCIQSSDTARNPGKGQRAGKEQEGGVQVQARSGLFPSVYLITKPAPTAGMPSLSLAQLSSRAVKEGDKGTMNNGSATGSGLG